MLDDVDSSFKLLKFPSTDHATLLAQQCCTMLASFEQAITGSLSIIEIAIKFSNTTLKIK